MSDNNHRKLWDEVDNMIPNSRAMSNEVDGADSPAQIADVFANKYDALYKSVPTDEHELNDIREKLDNLIYDEPSLTECNVNLKDVESAIKKLHKGKGDGNDGFYSDHVILSTNKFKVLVAMLMNSMLIHGYNAEELLASIIVSIPKSKRASLSTSENYRGISLCCSLCKVIDYVFINKYASQLGSSDLQYAFKEEHDTVTCSYMVKETVSYFTSKGSNVYACLLDASKAFDKVHFGKLFNLLMARSIPAIVIRLLLDNYTRQKICTKWNGEKSYEFTACNGVRQGGVLSPLLFTVYFDEMLLRLKKKSIGCMIGLFYLGAFAYADDVILLCPSRRGLQEMLFICESFAAEYSVSFNHKKTQCIKFCKDNDVDCGTVILNNNVLSWEKNVNHLGNILNQYLTDSDDIKKKKGHFVGSVNKLMSNFGTVQSPVLVKLFQSYCTSFYGCVLWYLSGLCKSDICTEWNKAVRKVWRLPYTAHTNMLGPLNGQCHIFEQFVNRFIKFYNRMCHSKNDTVNFLSNVAIQNMQSVTRKNMLFIKWRYNVDILNCNVYRCIHDVKHESKPSNEVLMNVNLLKELLLVRDRVLSINGLLRDECIKLIIHVSTGP